MHCQFENKDILQMRVTFFNLIIYRELGVRVMVFNATFNNISVISWRSFIYMCTLYNIKRKIIMVVYSMFPVQVRRRTLFSIHAQFALFWYSTTNYIKIMFHYISSKQYYVLEARCQYLLFWETSCVPTCSQQKKKPMWLRNSLVFQCLCVDLLP
jgi:hypothetical protein